MNPMTSLTGERDITLTANGQYIIGIGESSSGNLTRLDNFIEDFPKRKERLEALLKKNGVRVLSACEQITDSPEGIILESMIEGYAEYYSAELAQKVRRGMRESCLKGNAAGIQPIFGYAIIDKKYRIVESEAIIVRKLFEDYVNGSSIKELVEWLKNSGIRTHKGYIFSFGRVSELLRKDRKSVV